MPESCPWPCPPAKQALQQLALVNCRLRRLPRGVTQLSAVKRANLRDNPILLTMNEALWGARHGLVTDRDVDPATSAQPPLPWDAGSSSSSSSS